MKTLQTLAAETISECISKREDFEHLEVPKQLLAELNQSYDDKYLATKEVEEVVKERLAGGQLTVSRMLNAHTAPKFKYSKSFLNKRIQK